MITLYHRSGVNECLIPKAADDDSQGAVWHEAVKALKAQGLMNEAAFLSSAVVALRWHEATNHYGDKFLALRAAVTTEGYERLRRALGRVVILRFTTVWRTLSSLRCPYSRHSGFRRNPAS